MHGVVILEMCAHVYVSLCEDADTITTDISPSDRHSHWSSLHEHRQRVDKGLQQRRVSVLRNALSHVHCSNADLHDMYACKLFRLLLHYNNNYYCYNYYYYCCCYCLWFRFLLSCWICKKLFIASVEETTLKCSKNSGVYAALVAALFNYFAQNSSFCNKFTI